MRGVVTAVLVAASLVWPVAQIYAADGAVILLYHRFGEPQTGSTNTSVADLEAHIAYLKEGGHAVLPLEEIVSALRGSRALPERSIAITIDDAFASVYELAWPRLKAADLPFTLFVATGPIDEGSPAHMSWDQIRELADAGVTIGHHGVVHGHMADLGPREFRAEMAEASRRFLAELGKAPSLFAFPFGEANAVSLGQVRDLGFAGAFGQHSGVVHASLDPFYLPRFSLTGSFAGLDRLELAANTLPMPVRSLAPADPTLNGTTLAFSFELEPGAVDPEQLSCFVSGRGEVETLRDGRVVEVNEIEGLAPGRTRINCTAPAGDGRFYWLGMQYYRPN